MAAQGATKPLQPQTLPLFSGRLEISALHTEEQRSATGIQAFFFLLTVC